MNNRAPQFFGAQPWPFANLVASLGVILATAVAGGSDFGTGRLTSPARFALALDGREVGSTVLPAGSPVRVVAVEPDRLRVQSAVGSTWVSAGSVEITGEELDFEKTEILDAIFGKADRDSGARASCSARLRRMGVPRVPALPTGKENIPSGAPEAEKAVLDLVNRERRKEHLPPVSWDADLARAARFHAAHMANNRYFDHDTILPGKGKVLDCFERIAKFSDSSCSENIAFGQPNAREVMDCWMKSPGHRENILRKTAKTLGVGSVGGYWVQDFGQ